MIIYNIYGLFGFSYLNGNFSFSKKNIDLMFYIFLFLLTLMIKEYIMLIYNICITEVQMEEKNNCIDNVKYDQTLMIKISSDIKEKARKKAANRGQKLSEYVRDLMATDVMGE